MQTKFFLYFAGLFLCLNLGASDLSGKYKGTMIRSNGETLEVSMELKQEGNKVNGKVTSPGGEAEIQEGRVEGDKLTYVLRFERDGNSLVIRNRAQIKGDTLEGTSEFMRNGESFTREWKMKKEPANARFTGTWKSSFTRQDGNVTEVLFNLKQDGNRVTGTSSSGFGDGELSEGKVEGDEITFVIKRERGGRTITSRYSGKLEGNRIVGTSESDFAGQTRSRSWEAIRQRQ